MRMFKGVFRGGARGGCQRGLLEACVSELGGCQRGLQGVFRGELRVGVREWGGGWGGWV